MTRRARRWPDDAPRPAPRAAGESRLRESLRVLAQTCSLSLIYSLPWIAAFVLERRYPDLMQLPPDAAAPLSVALMASLILSGGFVQCIARKGQFYNSLSQPGVGGRRVPPHLAARAGDRNDRGCLRRSRSACTSSSFNPGICSSRRSISRR